MSAKSKKKRTVSRTNVIDFVAPRKAPTPAEPEPRKLYSWDLTICQIAVTLKHTDPPIWRRILVHQDTGLPKFHRILQCVMGWKNYHLHEFHIGPLKFGKPVAEEHYDVLSERNVKLSHIGDGDPLSFEYLYDLGDHWTHEVIIEERLAPEKGAQYPFCLEGARACPPEDSGGPFHYQDLLAVLAIPSHPRHKELLYWLPENFNPARFIPEIVNFKLKTLR